MDIDPGSLILAKTPNLERLARALHAPLPPRGPGYERELRRVVARALDLDRLRAAAEERREMEKDEIKKAALDIAASLGENGARQIAQIKRILMLKGIGWAREQCAEATGFYASGLDKPPRYRKDGQPRTLGGVFFEVCRRAASADVEDGEMGRREFFRCFFDYPPKPRPPVKAWKPIAPPLSPGVERSSVEPFAVMSGNHEIDPPGVVQHRTRGGKGVVGRLHERHAPKRKPRPEPEVYVRRKA